MRYLTGIVGPSERGAFHPLGRELTEDPAIERQAIHRVELLGDGTVLLLAEASGSQERYREIMDRSPHVVEYLTAGTDQWTTVSHFEPTDEMRRVLELQRDSLLVIDTPIHFTDDDRLKVTYLGTDKTFKTLFEYAKSAQGVTFDVIEMGDYEAEDSSFSRLMTSRQKEVLETAVDLGYYSEPRKATLEEIGREVSISPGTVGEHLRKVEERVFSAIVH